MRRATITQYLIEQQRRYGNVPPELRLSGAATDGRTRLRDVQPKALHQRIGVILGSKSEVERMTRYHGQ